MSRAPASRRSVPSWRASTTPRTAPSGSTAATPGRGRCAGCATRSASCSRTRSCSAAASGTTSPTGPTPTWTMIRARRPGSGRAHVHPVPARRVRHPARPGGRGPLRRPATADRHRTRPAAQPPRARAGRADDRSGRRERGAGDGGAAATDRGPHDDPDHPLDRAGAERRPRRGDGRRAGRRVRHPGAAAVQGLGVPHGSRAPSSHWTSSTPIRRRFSMRASPTNSPVERT